MIYGLTVLATVLLTITGLVMCLALFKELAIPPNERGGNWWYAPAFFFVGVLAEILAIGLLWI